MILSLIFHFARNREIENDTGPTLISPHRRDIESTFSEKAWVTDGDRTNPTIHSDVSFFNEATELGYYRYEGYALVNDTLFHKFYLIPPAG